MKILLRTWSVLVIAGCSTQATDSINEIEAVKSQLFVNVLESIKSNDVEKLLELMPEEGTVNVVFGDIKRFSKDEIREVHEQESKESPCTRYEFLEGPTIELLNSNHCYGTAKIKWICIQKTDSTQVEVESTLSVLAIGRKRADGKWELLANSQTEMKNKNME